MHYDENITVSQSNPKQLWKVIGQSTGNKHNEAIPADLCAKGLKIVILVMLVPILFRILGALIMCLTWIAIFFSEDHTRYPCLILVKTNRNLLENNCMRLEHYAIMMY